MLRPRSTGIGVPGMSAFQLVLFWAWVIIGVLAVVGISWEIAQSRLAARPAWSPPRRKQIPSGLPLVPMSVTKRLSGSS